jgi:hypothetical protein
MQKPLENTSISFQKPQATFPYFLMGTGVAVLLLAGAVVAVINKNWLLFAIFAVSLFGLAIYAIVSGIKIGKLTSSLSRNAIEWSAAMPDMQRQNLNIEVRELSKILQVESAQISDLQSAYIVAEDLALRQIQHEEGVPLMRHVSVGSVPFDAVFLKDNLLVCCEVSFLVAPELRQDRIESMMRKIAQAKNEIEKNGSGMSIRLMIALVTQLVADDEATLRSALNKQKFAETPVDIDIRLLDFEALQKMYVTDPES